MDGHLITPATIVNPLTGIAKRRTRATARAIKKQVLASTETRPGQIYNPFTKKWILDSNRNRTRIAQQRANQKLQTKTKKTLSLLKKVVANKGFKFKEEQTLSAKRTTSKINRNYKANQGFSGNLRYFTYEVTDPRAIAGICRDAWRRISAILVQAGVSGVQVTMEYYIDELGKYFDSHAMTSIAGADLSNVRISSLRDILALGGRFEADRLALEESYAMDGDANYYDVSKIRFAIMVPRFGTSYGDLFSKMLNSSFIDKNESEPGFCLAQAIRTTWPKTLRGANFEFLTNEKFTELTGFGSEGVRIQDLSHVEKTVVYTNRVKRVFHPRFVVFDQRLNLIRLPEFKPTTNTSKKSRQFCFLLAHSSHFYIINSHVATQNTRRDLGRIQAMWSSCGREVNYEYAYKQFYHHQNILPDFHRFWEVITDEITTETGYTPSITTKRHKQNQITWHAAGSVPEQDPVIRPIESLWLKHQLDNYHIEANGCQFTLDQVLQQDLALPAAQRKTTPIGPQPKPAPSMSNVLCFDLETYSTLDQVFDVYAIGWRTEDACGQLVAKTEHDLKGGLLQDFLELISSKAEQLPEGEHFYIYSYNGSRFDSVAIMYRILADSQETPSDLLESNGKLIRFTWGNCVFMDLCLLTMSSLKAACNSYGIKTQKGELPHQYLQGHADLQSVLRALHATVSWEQLEPFIDWFGDKSPDELQIRREGRTYAEWVEEQPMRKWWHQNKHVQFDFKKSMQQYLEKDVDALYELVEAVGLGLAEHGCNIRKQITIGSCASQIWRHTILHDIPKLDLKFSKIWAETNRGGFCGPLASLDTRAQPGQSIYKVDVTSLYPSCCTSPTYKTRSGATFSPIGKYWQGFPDARDGWQIHDFEGTLMTAETYDQLASMCGTVRVQFDQRDAPWPCLLKKMQCKTFQTLTPVLIGEEWYTVPQVRQAFDKGVKIWLHQCVFTTKTFSPFEKYMDIFRELKNKADVVKSRLSKISQRSPEQESELQKAGFDRTVAKLMLNSLLGRINMKIDRIQKILTRDEDDVILAAFNPDHYKNFDYKAIECGDNVVYRQSFHEGQYFDHIHQFAVAPYLSGMMLGYSKMLMVETFCEIKRLGGLPIYSDTDSVAFLMQDRLYPQYAERFVPRQKSFGAMELEGVYERLVTIGPKKYVCLAHAKDDSMAHLGIHKGDLYSDFKANGIPARQNTDRSILEIFEEVLYGTGESKVGYFSIKAQQNFQLTHTAGETKRVRNINLKGRVEENYLHWWETEEEFVEYCSGLRGCCERAMSELEQETRRLVDLHGDNLTTDLIAAQLRNRDATVLAPRIKIMADQDLLHRVYGIATAAGHTYIGYTTNVEMRVAQHNQERPGGANTTAVAVRAGQRWKQFMVARGFKSRDEATQFEWACQNVLPGGRSCIADMREAMTRVANFKKYRHIDLINTEGAAEWEPRKKRKLAATA